MLVLQKKHIGPMKRKINNDPPPTNLSPHHISDKGGGWFYFCQDGGIFLHQNSHYVRYDVMHVPVDQNLDKVGGAACSYKVGDSCILEHTT